MFAGFMGNSVLCTEPLEWKLGGFVFVEKALKDIIPTSEIPNFRCPGNNNNRRPCLVIVTSRGALIMKRGAAVCYPGRVWGYLEVGDNG